MRKTIYRSSEEEGRALLDRAPVVHLATTGEDGRPILRAVHGVVVAADPSRGGADLLAFHGAPAGEKMEGLGRRAVVASHEVIAEIPSWFLDPERACPATTYYVSAQVEGVLEELHDLDTKARILQRLMTKYQPEGRHVPIRGDDPLYTKAIKGLLVAGVRIEHVACKAKLGQNRKPEERIRVIEQLWKRGNPGDDRAVDFLVRRFPELTPPFLRARDLRLGCAVDEHDLEEIAALLADTYWQRELPRSMALAAIQRSTAVVTARSESGKLVAFARAVSDGRIAWVYDVIVREADRRTGAGTAVMNLLPDHPAVRTATHVRLATRDAMGFYRRLGFVELGEAPPRTYRVTEMIRPERVPRID
jgi:nitroimidazol reductase NimA-like FMN-containing flavoprotein (pyridoxamine 5'-phosphate oxidase superfamily)/ribosomal protein S18 acetylase RimI-like enzyme